MRAMLLKAPSGLAEDLAVIEAERPVPAPGEVLIEVAYGGCNFADTMMWRGTYPHPKGCPIIAGLEISGRIAALGEGVTGMEVGDRVAAVSEDAGGFADFVAVPDYRIVPLPDAVGLDQAAATVVQALTAWHMLHTVSVTRPGDVVLVHAIGGGVGLYLTQFLKKAGAVTIGTVGTRGKEARALDYGAALVINREEQDFVPAVMEFTGGKGVDKIVDSTGASILDRSFETIRKLGHVVSYGEAEGKPFTNLWERLVRKSLTFTRFHLGHSDFASAAWQEGLADVYGSIANGSLIVPIESSFPFEDVAAMYQALESRRVSGKLLLEVNPAL